MKFDWRGRIILTKLAEEQTLKGSAAAVGSPDSATGGRDGDQGASSSTRKYRLGMLRME